jgi:hypothetical protein
MADHSNCQSHSHTAQPLEDEPVVSAAAATTAAFVAERRGRSLSTADGSDDKIAKMTAAFATILEVRWIPPSGGN